MLALMTWCVFICLTTELTGVAVLNPPPLPPHTHPASLPCAFGDAFSPTSEIFFFLDDTRGACMHHSRDCPFERNTISEAAIWSTRVLFFVVVCATKCQMFAFLTRARWRGWMLGSRTTSELRFAEIFSVDRTQKRSAGMRRIRRERRCSVSGRLTISIWWKAGRSLRAVTTGCKTTTHRNFIAGSLTADREALPETATGWITTAVTGRRVSNQAKTVRRKGVQKMQVRAVIFLVLIGFIWASRRCSSCVCVCGSTTVLFWVVTEGETLREVLWEPKTRHITDAHRFLLGQLIAQMRLVAFKNVLHATTSW